MNPQSSVSGLRLVGLVLIAGVLIFWGGAFYMPLMKAYTARTIEEHLSAIASNRLAWQVSNGMMALGGLLGGLAMVALGDHLHRTSGGHRLVALAAALWIVCSALWLTTSAFRMTVTAWSAEQLAAGLGVPAFLPPLHRWNNLVVVMFMMLAYAATALYGFEMLHAGGIPRAVAWFALSFGTLGVFLRPAGVLFFEPPLMVELVPLGMGVSLVWRGR